MTCDHLMPLLRNSGDSELFCEFIRLGRMTALRKPPGGARGIVVGYVLREVGGRTVAQVLGNNFKAATAPHQYALITRSGCESIAHVLQRLTDLDPQATVLSVDGAGAFDLISRATMMTAFA